uniref:hypothetical protein n=1 Tax=Ningiella ruwaisensis TaxID=2364274 RepID=UPI0010A0B2E6|nr:hypothetical protein [Ningiella ruwaisensis]
MKISAEISCYPLDDNYTSIVLAFIERLQDDENLSVSVGKTATFVTGDADYLMAKLGREFTYTYQQVGQAVFVCKFMNPGTM